MSLVRLDAALQAWGQPEFAAVLKRELEALPHDKLPLQQGLAHSSSVVLTPFTVLVNGMAEHDGCINVRAGILYQGEIGGCSCAGDPGDASPVDEYCEVEIILDKAGAHAEVRLA